MNNINTQIRIKLAFYFDVTLEQIGLLPKSVKMNM